jgi:hypothetical protein
MVVAAPHDQVRSIVERAYQRTLAAGRTPPESFAHSRLDLGPAVEWQRPEILPLEDARSRVASLHELPEIAPWVPPDDAMRKLDLELGQIATSPLVVSPSDRQLQVASLVDRLVDELTPEFRAQIAERLEETALMLDGDNARLCIAAAQLTREGANPFLQMLFEKLIKKETP